MPKQIPNCESLNGTLIRQPQAPGTYVSNSRTTENTNNLSSASSIVGNGENVSDAGGEILELLDDAVEGGPTGKDEQSGLRVRVRRVRV